MPTNNHSSRRPAFIKYWLPVIIYAIIIFSASSIPGRAIPGIFEYQDTIFHFFEYAVLAVLLSRAFKGTVPGVVRGRRFYLVFVFSLLYALSDEAHQFFVPGRTASLYDIAVDALGALAGSALYLWRK